MKKSQRIGLLASILLFGISLTQEAYCTTNLCRPGFDAVISGAFGFLFGASIVWLANPFIILSWAIFIRWPKTGLLFSFLAVLISLSFLLQKKILDNEAGHENLIVSYGLGYWLWTGSVIIIFINTAISYFANTKHLK